MLCSGCGHANVQEALFCAACGQALPSERTGPGLGERRRSPLRPAALFGGSAAAIALLVWLIAARMAPPPYIVGTWMGGPFNSESLIVTSESRGRIAGTLEGVSFHGSLRGDHLSLKGSHLSLTGTVHGNHLTGTLFDIVFGFKSSTPLSLTRAGATATHPLHVPGGTAGHKAATQSTPQSVSALPPVFIPIFTSTGRLAPGYSVSGPAGNIYYHPNSGGPRGNVLNWLNIQQDCSLTFIFTVPPGSPDLMAYGVPANSWVNNGPADFSLNGRGVSSSNQPFSAGGSSTRTAQILWHMSLKPGPYRWTVSTPSGSSVNVYGLWFARRPNA